MHFNLYAFCMKFIAAVLEVFYRVWKGRRELEVDGYLTFFGSKKENLKFF